MKTVTITVTDTVAKKLVTLANTGRVTPGGRGRRDAGYLAYTLATEHARPFDGKGWLREIVVDGVTHILPDSLAFGTFRR